MFLKLKKTILKLSPVFLVRLYHLKLAFLGAFFYGFPSRKIKIIGITGTKGKSSTLEILNKILEDAGFKTALIGTIRFKVGSKEIPNLKKMTMPGRFFVQKIIREAVKEKCDFVIMEITSEGSKQWRHRFLELNTLIFTNLAPEHIESHGSYEKYREAKLQIVRKLNSSSKKNKFIVLNKDDKETPLFEKVCIDIEKIYFSKNDFSNGMVKMNNTEIKTNLVGEFNLYNIASAVKTALKFGVSIEKIKQAVENFQSIPGRAEEIDLNQKFKVVVDYAHTPNSLEAIYKAYPGNKVCVLGATGGGRDKWKRKILGEIADTFCEKIFLTDEDPYDENPREIVDQVFEGITNKNKVEIEMDRRMAINKALKYARKNNGINAVILTGKGVDPYIMRANGEKEIWNEKQIATEELKKVLR